MRAGARQPVATVLAPVVVGVLERYGGSVLIRGFVPGPWIDRLDFSSLEPVSEAQAGLRICSS